jgi:hypothetical protein
VVEVLRRYSSQTYQIKTLTNLRRLLDAAPTLPRESAQIGHIHRLDVRLRAATILEGPQRSERSSQGRLNLPYFRGRVLPTSDRIRLVCRPDRAGHLNADYG